MVQTPTDWIVTSQWQPTWPAKQYRFRDEGQARMFLHMCQRDGDFRCSLASPSL